MIGQIVCGSGPAQDDEIADLTVLGLPRASAKDDAWG